MLFSKLFEETYEKYHKKSSGMSNISDKTELDGFQQLLVECMKVMAVLQDENSGFNKFCTKYCEQLEKMKANLESLSVIIEQVYDMMSDFDFRDVRFNGFRSFFLIIKKCVFYCLDYLKRFSKSFLINRTRLEEQWQEYGEFLSQLTLISKYILQIMLLKRSSKSLFMDRSDDEDIYKKFMWCYENLTYTSFYGSCLGFYLCDSCQIIVKVICSTQLGLGCSVERRSDLEVFVSTVLNGAQSLWLENKRGAQMSEVFNRATVTFCKQFWNLVDNPLLLNSMQLVLPHLAVVKLLPLISEEINLPSIDGSGSTVKIHPVTDHGTEGVKIRVLSRFRLIGMEFLADKGSKKLGARSTCLLFHIHGGGFVAQSSESHDSYLRQWAIDLNCPIVSVNYSHAPEHPYPRALNECFYAYCWVLKNITQLGCTPDCRIVICGDSAGGNLSLCCTIKAIEIGVRIPDGVFVAYPATLIEFMTSPARILGVLDPVLPMGVLTRCLLAYIGENEESLVHHVSNVDQDQNTSSIRRRRISNEFHEEGLCNSSGSRIFYSRNDAISPIKLLEYVNFPKNSTLSPLLAAPEVLQKFPPLSIVASQFDPLLDDSIEFCKTVERAGAKFIKLQVMPDLPHGFLNMASPVTKECLNAMKICTKEIKTFLLGDFIQV